MLGGWSTWQWVFLDTPEYPGSLSVLRSVQQNQRALLRFETDWSNFTQQCMQRIPKNPKEFQRTPKNPKESIRISKESQRIPTTYVHCSKYLTIICLKFCKMKTHHLIYHPLLYFYMRKCNIINIYIIFVRKKSRYFAKHSLSMQKKSMGHLIIRLWPHWKQRQSTSQMLFFAMRCRNLGSDWSEQQPIRMFCTFWGAPRLVCS